jgi:Ca2+-binding RTX toxin-like protein
MVFAAPPTALTAADDLLSPDGLPGAGDLPGPGWLPPDWLTGPAPQGSSTGLVAGQDAPGQSDVMLPDAVLPGAVSANAGKGADDADLAPAIPVRVANETLRGTDGDDTLRGSRDAGDHWVYGGGGDDMVFVFTQSNGIRQTYHLFGGDGDDYLQAALDDQNLFYGGAGNDTIRLAGSRFTAFGGEGDDILQAKVYSSPSDEYNSGDGDGDGGAGTDTLVASGSGISGMLISLTRVARADYPGGYAVDMTFRNMEILHAVTSSANDTLHGGNGADILDAGSGANRVAAHGGDDVVEYDLRQANVLDGGSGNDTLVVNPALGGRPPPMHFTVTGTTVTDGYGSALRNFEHYHVHGHRANDRIRLDAGHDRVLAHRGNDTLWGGGGNDWLEGEDGNDLAWGGGARDTLWGGAGDDTLHGGGMADTLFGGFDDDALFGGEGNDILNGVHGSDTLTGGAGADEFRFAILETGPGADARADLLLDMQPGLDRILIAAAMIGQALPVGALDPSRLAQDAAVGSDLQFVLVAGLPGGRSGLYLDTNGSAAGGATLLVLLEGAPAISADDIFIF